MIVLCPKAFSSADGLSLERDFLKHFLSKYGKKATIANEIWETFRFKLLETNPNVSLANKTIAEFKGVFTPEEENIDKNHQEVAPEEGHDIEVLVDKTRDLLKRRWADVDMFITTDPMKYKDIPNIEILTLQEFFLSFMSADKDRRLIEEFLDGINREKWE